ncbi:MAG: ABC transporter permease [Rhizobiaceae bacterium]
MASPVVPTSKGRLLVTSAREDLLRGLVNWRVYGRLGWLEVKRRYRRTIIGPFWSAISVAIMVGALGSIGVVLWQQSPESYIPYLAAGLVVWIMISTMVTEACTLFISGHALFRQSRFDYSVLAYALVWRNLVAFGHNLVIYLVAILVFAPYLLKPVGALAIPGLALVLINGVWISLFLGILCLRFRDLQPLVTNLIQVLIFVTPIFWPAEKLSGGPRAVFVTFNPIFHLIEVVRAPLVGQAPTAETYIALGLITVVGWAVTYVFFSRFRKRIAYWS